MDILTLKLNKSQEKVTLGKPTGCLGLVRMVFGIVPGCSDLSR